MLQLPVVPMDPTLTQIRPGQRVRLRYGGFVPRERVRLYVASTPVLLADGFADGNGEIELEGIIPSDLDPGSHSLVLLGDSGVGFRQTVSATTSALPSTGSESATLALSALVVVMVGSVLTLLARRRRSVR